jgi:ABC-type uncharacterized transport system, ATPase component
MTATNERIIAQNLTCLMITHHLDDALKYGNRLVVLVVVKSPIDVSGEEKQQLTQEKLYSFFSDLQE